MKIVTMIPTYNEAGNIERIINEVLNCLPDSYVLTVDDMSPDGTYKIVQDISKLDKNVSLLLRTQKRGRGYAGIDGFKKALEMGADFIVEMDGDGSHNPKYIPKFLETIKDCDVVIGSRYIRGGKDEARDFIRRSISAFARLYLSFFIGVNVKDPTSGFRMFRRQALEKIVEKLKASDPFIVAEVLYYLKKENSRIKEYPIEFQTRFTGESKLKATTLFKYLFKVLKLRLMQ